MYRPEIILCQIKCIQSKTNNPREDGTAGGNDWHLGAPLVSKAPVSPKPRNAKRAVPTRSESTEDHLERIQELVDQKGYARVSDIALSLGLSRSAVSNMVRRLARRGYVNYERYRGFTLTAEGRAVAQHIKVRHKTLAELLHLLGVSAETVEEEVEAVEHHLKPETLRVFAKLVQFWQAHPGQLEMLLEYCRTK
jgi:Mn-dependent DtxR family transcriptional regulator